MDRRQVKTRDAIFRALSELLSERSFNKITVQDIIDRANIGRSTFYAHFETKDELLDELCNDMFSHIFLDSFPIEKTHDFSKAGESLGERLAHLLWHIKDNERNVVTMLSGEESDLFMTYFKPHLNSLFASYLSQIQSDVPEDLLLSHLAGSFAETVRWWIRQKMRIKPEEVIHHYFALMQLPLA